MRGLSACVMAGVLVAAGVSLGSESARPDQALGPIIRVQAERDTAQQELSGLEHERLRLPYEDDLLAEAARTAWRFVDGHVQSNTGLIDPVRNYPFATIWDIGSMLAALYSAHELGLVDRPTYEARIHAILATLARVRLYDDAVFNRSYDTRNGVQVRRHPGSGQVIGWSEIDVGRLIWLRIVGSQPEFAEAASAVVHRNDMRRLVKAGYLWGADLDQLGHIYSYQEGRIGYEQYGAQGFALWGFRADKALNLMENAVPITIMGQPLVADVRRWDRLTNEPFLLLGLELGWSRQTAALVRRLVRAQEARYRQTGLLTITGEDAIAQPPHYFYYYSAYSNGKAFGVDVQDRQAMVEGPRWVSAKSAFALHVLMPSRYSELALRQLREARDADGWASGIDEATGASTATANINTAAVILTSALVHRLGEPVLAHALRSREAAARSRGGP